MKKKLLAGIMALALCSTSMPQMIFAEEFTSEAPEETEPEETGETPEVFTDENPATTDDTIGGASTFNSEEIPEFDDEEGNVSAATDGGSTAGTSPIDINNYNNSVYTISTSGSYRFTGTGTETSNRIVIDNVTSGEVKIYLNNVNINTGDGPALQITSTVTAQVCIYLEGQNILKTTLHSSAALQKDNNSGLTITSTNTVTGSLAAQASCGAGIGSGQHIGGASISGNTVSNITISNCSIEASSTVGAGIGSGHHMGGASTSGNTVSNITISNCSIKASSTNGAGIGSGYYVGGASASISGNIVSDITISNSSIEASSITGAGIGSGHHMGGASASISGNIVSNITISNCSVTTSSTKGAGIGSGMFSVGGASSISGNTVSNITISGGSVKATKIDCTPKDSKNNDVYLCEISNAASSEITIDAVKRNGPYNHSSIDPSDTTLYAWLTGTDHVVTVGNDSRKYSFANNSFTRSKVDPTASQFTFTPPPNLTYDGNNKIASVTCKNGIEGMGTITVKYYKEGSTVPLSSSPTGIGTYIVKITIEEGSYYLATTDLTDASWKFTINCEHSHTVSRYYSSASCTSSGYSGDTYCTDCGSLVSSGYTISAYGHDYDNGVITTAPTAETDGVITYTCKRCKHQDTRTLGKLNDGEPYIEGDFLKKGWDSVKEIIKKSKEKDLVSITLNGAQTLPASVLSGIKGKDISLNLDMENGFIWKINGTSITAETPADTDLSVTNTAEHIPAALYSLISTNQNDFGFHLGKSGDFDFPAVLSVKADASCAGLMANLFWYDAENGVLQCIQTVTVGGAFERSIPYADFTLSKGQDYFIAFGTESLNGRVIHTDGSITDENGAYLRPANTKISSHSIDRNKLTVKLSKGCAGAQGYDFVISKKSNMLQTGKFSKKVSSTGKPQASFRYLAKGTWYVAARSWVLDEQGNKVYGSWTKIKKIKITVATPQQPKIKDITVKENTVTVTYTKCKNATGYEILLGNKYKTSAGEKYPVKKYLKRTEGKNTVTVTFTNVKKGTWYVTVRSWNKTSKNKSRVYSPYSDIKKFKVKK